MKLHSILNRNGGKTTLCSHFNLEANVRGQHCRLGNKNGKYISQNCRGGVVHIDQFNSSIENKIAFH